MEEVVMRGRFFYPIPTHSDHTHPRYNTRYLRRGEERRGEERRGEERRGEERKGEERRAEASMGCEWRR